METPVIRNSPLRSAYKRNIYRRHNIYAWLFLTAEALIAATLLFVLFLSPVRVNGASMSPTLMEDDVLLIDKLSLYLINLKRGELVIFYHPDTDEELIKRVIGLPGETIEIKDGFVYINGFLLDESAYSPSKTADFPVTYVDENTVFVLGDDREKSLDSRELGAVNMSEIDGRVRFRVSPLGRAAMFG